MLRQHFPAFGVDLDLADTVHPGPFESQIETAYASEEGYEVHSTMALNPQAGQRTLSGLQLVSFRTVVAQSIQGIKAYAFGP